MENIKGFFHPVFWTLVTILYWELGETLSGFKRPPSSLKARATQTRNSIKLDLIDMKTRWVWSLLFPNIIWRLKIIKSNSTDSFRTYTALHVSLQCLFLNRHGQKITLLKIVFIAWSNKSSAVSPSAKHLTSKKTSFSDWQAIKFKKRKKKKKKEEISATNLINKKRG